MRNSLLISSIEDNIVKLLTWYSLRKPKTAERQTLETPNVEVEKREELARATTLRQIPRKFMVVLKRMKQRQIPFTVLVSDCAASGGPLRSSSVC